MAFASCPWLLRGLLIVLALAPTLAAVELWVDPAGNDRHAGTPDAPFASLAAAQRQARELRRRQDPAIHDGIRIRLRDGIYRLEQPVVLRPEDSGTAELPTVIEAAPGARPILSGGVPVTGWRRLTETVPGLPAAARSHLWVADTPPFHGRPLEFRQLWVGDRKATRARTPNGSTLAQLTGWDRAAETATLPANLIAPLPRPDGVELVVQQQWEIANLRIRQIEPVTDGLRLRFHQPESRLEFEHPWPQPILPPEGGGACFLANAIEFLDAPGEWYQDRAAGRIYYWPQEDEDLARVAVTAPALETLLRIEGTADRPVRHVHVQGLSFQHTTWLRPSLAGHVPLQAGLYLEEAYKLTPKGTPDWRSLDNQAWIGRPPAAVSTAHTRDVRFLRCRFEQLAMTGLDLVAGAQAGVVEGCLLRDVGGNGIQLGAFHTGPIETHLPYDPADLREVCQDLRIANNLVTDVANEDWGCVGIIAGFVRDVTIEHNEVTDVSYTAISLGWGWTRTLNVMRNNRVHANLLHRYATRMCDTAAVYTLSAQPGTVVSENVAHSVTMAPYVDRPDHWFYYYLDEGSSFIHVRDNWCPEPRFLANANGPGNIWENNGPQVAEAIRQRAGLQPAFQDLRQP